MAPEIMRYNGEEEYTEKVDCFSFGMFIYELLTLHQPFEGHESVKECILEGGRPPLTYRVSFVQIYRSWFDVEFSGNPLSKLLFGPHGIVLVATTER